MTRIAPLPRSKFGLTARMTDAAVRKMVGRSIDGVGISARVPALLRASGGMERMFMSKRRATPHRLFELVAVRAAMEIGCAFCMDLGSYLAQEKHGVTEEEVRALSDHAASGVFSSAEVAALDLAVAMSQTPASVSDALWSRLAEHFDETQLLELVAMIGWENSRARIAHALEIESHGFTAGGTCAVQAMTTTRGSATISA